MVCVVSCATIVHPRINQKEERESQLNQVINYVPTEKVAREIAVIILTPIYGKENIEKQKPFNATLLGDSVWVVEGTRGNIEGGTAYIEIQKRDCKILKVTHEK